MQPAEKGPPSARTDRRSFSPEEVAYRNNVGRTFIFGEIKAKRLHARKLGRLTRITLEDEAAWLQTRAGLPLAEAERTAWSGISATGGLSNA